MLKNIVKILDFYNRKEYNSKVGEFYTQKFNGGPL